MAEPQTGRSVHPQVVKLLLVAEITLDRLPEVDQDPKELARQRLDQFREAVQSAQEWGIVLCEPTPELIRESNSDG